MKKRDRVKRTKAPPLDVSIIIPQSERERERHPVETCRSSLPRVSIFYVIDKKKKQSSIFRYDDKLRKKEEHRGRDEESECICNFRRPPVLH